MFCAINHQNCSRNRIFTSQRFTQLYHLWRTHCTLERAGVAKELRMISDLFVGASFFKLRNQRPPMCYSSNVVRGSGRRWGRICRLAQRHTWNLDPLPLRPCWQMGESRAQLPRSTPALATHWANTDSVYRSLFAVDGHFPLSPVPPRRVPLFGRRD